MLLFRTAPGRTGVRTSFLAPYGGHFKGPCKCTVPVTYRHHRAPDRQALDPSQSRWRLRRLNQATPAAANDGAVIRARNDTGSEKVSTGHPRCVATLRRARSGLTTVGWPTTSSRGRSVIESE